MEKMIDGEVLNVPRHVAIILDGNGRWAKKRHMPRSYGHVQGSRNVEKVCSAAWDLGIEYLTMYAFSTENWNRPEDEVKTLMSLLREYLKDSKEKATRNNMRVRVIGGRDRLDPDILKVIDDLTAYSAGNTGLNFTIALNYGSRDEMVRAMRKMSAQVAAGNLLPDQITEEVFEGYLDTAGIPDPDLMIRTSGEQRLSNYMLWQMAYTEFYFTNVLWPDFDRQELVNAVRQYSQRDRRYGGV